LAGVVFGFSSNYNPNTNTHPNRYTHTYSDANPDTDSVAFTEPNTHP
jgi:hypothetical protein